jgi:hypothetical protein
MIEDKEWWIKRINRIDAIQLAWEVATLIFVDETYRIQRSTDDANRLFGYVPGELDGKELGVIIPPEYRERHRWMFADFMKNPIDRSMGKDIMRHVFDGWHKDETKIKVSILLRVRFVEGVKIAVAKIFPVIEIKPPEAGKPPQGF